MTTSIIVRSAIRYLLVIIAMFSIFSLLRGHDEPGGGFIGGLLGATCFVLYALAYDVPTSRRMLRIEEHQLIGWGLLLAALTGAIGVVLGDPFLSAYWLEGELPILGTLKLGTPLLFDVGVYLAVMGAVLMIMFSLADA